MSTKWIVVLFVCVVCSPLVLAYDPLVFNRSVSAGNLVLTTETFELSIGSGNVTSILLEQGNESIIMAEGSCKRFGYERLCHEEKLNQNSVRLSLLDLRANLATKLSFNQSTARVGSSVLLRFELNNSGLSETDMLSALIRLHENVSVVRTRGCSSNASHILFVDKVFADQGHDCLVTLHVHGLVDSDFKTVVHYSSFGSERFVNSTSMSFSASMPFMFNVSSEDFLSVEPAQPLLVRVHFHNNGTSNLTIPKIQLVYGSHAQSVDGSSSTFSLPREGSRSSRLNKLVIGDNVSVDFNFFFTKADIEGFLELHISYADDENATHYSFVRRIPYSTVSVPVDILVSPEELSFESLQTANINVSVRNNYRYLEFKGYDIVVNSSLFPEVRQQLPYARHRVLAQASFLVPEVLSVKSSDVFVRLRAQSVHGQDFFFEQKFPVELLPLRGLGVETLVDPDERKVRVFVENRHSQDVRVHFSARGSNNVFLSGVLLNETLLLAGQTAQVLSYAYLFDPDSLDEQAVFSLSYSYEYLGVPLSQEAHETVSITHRNSTPLVVVPRNESVIVEEDLHSEEIISEAEVSDSLLFWFIGMGLALFVLAIVIKMLVKHTYGKKKKTPHNASAQSDTISAYNALLQEDNDIHQQKLMLSKELSRIQEEMSAVENRMKGFQIKLPEEIQKMSSQRAQVMNTFTESQKKRGELSVHIQKIQEQNASLLAYEEKLKLSLQELDTHKQSLENDFNNLKLDKNSLQNEADTIHKKEESLSVQHKALDHRIKEMKKSHADELKSRISEITREWENSIAMQRELRQEEDRLRKEFEKIEHDLNESLVDVEESEKIYKETSNALDSRGAKDESKNSVRDH